MSLTSSIKGSILGNAINKISASEPKTTLAGFTLAGIVAANIDYGKLIQKDPAQMGNLVAAVVIAMLGWYTNNHKGGSSGNTNVPNA